MPTLDNYDEFEGLHWETGSLRNYLAFKGIKAPHTNQPYSEGLLLGVSGGITMGYFTFDYEGYDPMIRILTRNTFDPMDRIYKRLDIETTVKQTSSADKGIQNLESEIDTGSPAIVFADMYSLPYNALEYDEGMWAMLPILVFGYNEDQDEVLIADRSRKPLSVTTSELAEARGRTKKNKYRLLVHEAPHPDKLREAVTAALRDCIENFTQPPPKGSKSNFGFPAFQKWIDLLQKPNQRGSWQKDFEPGPRMYAGLKSAFEAISIFGKNGGADRTLYADFLEEASLILSEPQLEEVADQFRASAGAWDILADSLLPEEIPLLGETRQLMLKKHHLFIEHGASKLDQILEINVRLSEMRKIVEEEFPLTQSQVEDLRSDIADKVRAVQDIEIGAIESLTGIVDIEPKF